MPLPYKHFLDICHQDGSPLCRISSDKWLQFPAKWLLYSPLTNCILLIAEGKLKLVNNKYVANNIILMYFDPISHFQLLHNTILQGNLSLKSTIWKLLMQSKRLQVLSFLDQMYCETFRKYIWDCWINLVHISHKQGTSFSLSNYRYCDFIDKDVRQIVIVRCL